MSNDASTTGRQIWAVLELLDRQLVDRDGWLVGKVDDVEFEIADDPGARPRVTALLAGLGALANHIGGDTGRALAATERRLAADRDRLPSRVELGMVREIGSAITLDADRDEFDTNRGERWVRDVIIDKIREPAMLLSELLGAAVVTTDGESLGDVRDVLVVQDGPMGAHGTAGLQLHALAVGSRSFGTRLGFAQGTVRGPWLLRKLLHKRPLLVPWDAIVRRDEDRIVVDRTRLEDATTGGVS